MPRSKMYVRLLLIPGLLLVGFLVVLPLLWILPISFGEPARGAFTAGGVTLGSYLSIVTTASLRLIVLRTFVIAVVATALATTMALPVAYFMARSGAKLKSALTALVLFPFLVGTVVQAIGWIAILSPGGILSQVVRQTGLTDDALDIMRTPVTVTLLIATTNMPFVLITLLSSFESVGTAGERAALSLGASRLRVFWGIVMPQVMPGIVAGTTLSFILAVNAYPTPVLIGAGQVRMASPEIYNIITRDGNWPQGTALAIATVGLTLIVSGLYGSLMSKRFDKWRRVS